jgi:hypothetical protein
MKRKNFVSTKNLQNAIQKRVRKNTDGEKVNLLKICWMKFCKSAPYAILYKISTDCTEFKTLDLSPICRGRPPKFEKISLTPLYTDARLITYKVLLWVIELLLYFF